MTDLTGWAILVLNTFRTGEWKTGSVRISSESNLASALGKVLSHQAVGVLSTGVVGFTGVNAIPVLAGLSHWAFRVRSAANGDATPNRVTLISGQAPTVANVALWVAFSIDPTGVIKKTWVDTLSIAAGFPVLAFSV